MPKRKCKNSQCSGKSMSGKDASYLPCFLFVFFSLLCCGSSHQRSLRKAGLGTKGFTTVIISGGEQADKVKGSLICLRSYFIRMFFALTTKRLSSESLQTRARGVGSQAPAHLSADPPQSRPQPAMFQLRSSLGLWPFFRALPDCPAATTRHPHPALQSNHPPRPYLETTEISLGFQWRESIKFAGGGGKKKDSLFLCRWRLHKCF